MKNIEEAAQIKTPIEAIKIIPSHLLQQVYQYIIKFLKGNKDYEEWYIIGLRPVPKSKDLSNTNKWSNSTLADVISIICSIIISKRLQKTLSKYGVKEQCGFMSEKRCTDMTSTLHNALHTRKIHGLPTWLLFINLVKVFVTVSHEMLWEVLAVYGVVPLLIEVITRMYRNTKFVLKVEEEERYVNSKIVCQKRRSHGSSTILAHNHGGT